MKKDPRTANAKVAIETKMPVRRVLVDKVAAFEYEKDDAIGVCTGAFTDLSIDLSRYEPWGRAVAHMHRTDTWTALSKCCAVPVSTVS